MTTTTTTVRYHGEYLLDEQGQDIVRELGEDEQRRQATQLTGQYQRVLCRGGEVCVGVVKCV